MDLPFLGLRDYQDAAFIIINNNVLHRMALLLARVYFFCFSASLGLCLGLSAPSMNTSLAAGNNSKNYSRLLIILFGNTSSSPESLSKLVKTNLPTCNRKICQPQI
jgi:hypothetical protein